MGRPNESLAFVFRFRVLLLSAMAGATVAALAALIIQAEGNDLVLVGPLLAAVILSLAIVFLRVRHFYLAIATVLAPLPGLVWAGILAAPGPQTIILVYTFAVALSIFIAGMVADSVARGESAEPAASRAFTRVLVSCALTVLLLSVLLVIWFVQEPEKIAITGIQMGFSCLSALIITPLVASGLRYSEAYLEAFNRLREARGRVMESMAMVAVPRWGVSFAGIALVFAVLGWFGANDLIRDTEFLAQPALWIASIVAIFLSGYALGGGWRNATALAGAFVTVLTCGLWALEETGIQLTNVDFMELPLAMAGSLLAALILLVRAERYRRTGDHVSVGLLRAIEKCGISIFYSGLAGLVSLAPLTLSHPEWPALAVMVVMGGLAAGIFMPAFATLLEAIFPRRRTLEEVFGKR